MSVDQEAIYEARLELVDFVVEVFWDVPNEAFLERLLAGEVSLPEESVDETLDRGFDRLRAFVEENRDRPVDAVHDDLATEYTRVFVGPRPPVLPHETAYSDDSELLGTGLAEIEASYGAAGWTPPDEYPEESDFLAVELAFLRHLIARQRAGQEEAFGYERVFLDEHLGTWADAFAEDVLEETDEELFQAGALVLQGLVAFEDQLVAQTVSG